MRWAEIDDKERVRLILQHILKWKYYTVFDSFHTALWSTGKYQSVGYPVAVWSDKREKWSVFYRENEDGCPFDPLHDMNEAWQILLRICEQYATPRPNETEQFRRFAETLMGDERGSFEDEMFPAGPRLFLLVRRWTPDLICKAALQAVGVVEEEEW